MRRNKFIAGIGIGIFAALPAAGQEISVTAGSLEKFTSAANKIKCSDYKMPEEQSQYNACQSCQKEVQGLNGDLQKAVQKGVSTNNAQNAAGVAKQKANAGATGDAQTDTQDGAKKGFKSGNGDMAAKTANAKEVGNAFNQCKQKMESSCNPGQLKGQDQQGASEAKQACEEGSKQAEAVAAEKSGNGMDMGQLGQMAQQLAQGLGSMMQKKGGEKPNTPDTSGSSVAPPPEAVLGESKPGGTIHTAQSATFDNLGASRTGGTTGGQATTNGGPAGPLAANSQSYDSGGTGPGTEGSDPRGAGSGDRGGGGAGVTAGGGGGGGSSGSSQYDPDAAAAKAAAGGQDGSGAYEISSGGGSSGRFLGLKSKGADLSDLDGALGGEAGSGGLNLAALGEGEGGGRDLASDGESQSADIHADGSSLFSVVRSKLVEIKKRGNI